MYKSKKIKNRMKKIRRKGGCETKKPALCCRKRKRRFLTPVLLFGPITLFWWFREVCPPPSFVSAHLLLLTVTQNKTRPNAAVVYSCVWVCVKFFKRNVGQGLVPAGESLFTLVCLREPVE